MSDYVERNAIIKHADLFIEDHGLLTIFLTLEFDGSGQGFGGYALYADREFKNGRLERSSNHCGHFVWRCLEIAGVQRWHDLVGKTIRVRQCNRDIEAIGHIVKNDWFFPRKDFGAD